MRYPKSCLAVITLAMSTTAAAAGAPPSYSATDLGFVLPGHTSAYPTGITPAGRIIGWANPPAVLPFDGFITGPEGEGAEVLVAGGQRAFPNAIEGGKIAITLGTSNAGGIARIGANRLREFSTLGGTLTSVWAVNSRGQGAGASFLATSGSPYHAVSVDDRSAAVHDLAAPGTANSSAYAINESGKIVGTYYTPSSNARPFIADADGIFVDLGLSDERLGITGQGEALGINNKGQVVGYAYGAPSTSYPYITHENGKDARYLRSIDGAIFTALTGINSHGQAVGYEEGVGTHGFDIAVVTSPDGSTLYRLDTLVTMPPGVDLIDDAVIGDNGEIAVTGSNLHLYLLKPIGSSASPG